jgi:hypothetical protein
MSMIRRTGCAACRSAGLLHIILVAMLWASMTTALSAAAGEHEAPVASNTANPAGPGCASTPKIIGYDRVGGLPGFRDHVEIHADGCYTILRRGVSAVRRLNALQLEDLKGWSTRWRAYEAEHASPPGASDRLYTHFSFAGTGDEPLDPQARREIESWLRELLH